MDDKWEVQDDDRNALQIVYFDNFPELNSRLGGTFNQPILQVIRSNAINRRVTRNPEVEFAQFVSIELA